MIIKGNILVFLFVFHITITTCVSCRLGGQEDQPLEPEVPCETRATWLWASSIDSPEKRASVLQKISAAHLNTVFVSIPAINQNFGFGKAKDFLAFITGAKKQGLSAHGWMANGMRKGRKVEIDLRDKKEQEAQVQWVLKLMDQFGDHLDGVHLDYIRTMKPGAVNHQGKMAGVTTTIRKINNRLKTDYPGKHLTATCIRLKPKKEESYKDPPGWIEDVPRWFRDWYAANPGSIYHGPDHVLVPLYMKFQQNPIGWLKESIVENVMPMQYTIEDKRWKREIDYFKSFNEFVGNDPTRIYMGISWQPKKGFDPPGVVRKIKYARFIGMKGFVIFILCNHEYDDSPLIRALSVDSALNDYDAPFKKAVPSCLE